jgi:hypothetical protein
MLLFLCIHHLNLDSVYAIDAVYKENQDEYKGDLVCVSSCRLHVIEQHMPLTHIVSLL